ncbi:inner membrane protease [Anaeramoeba ignava]|uniref:Mitochondrial inner membrane protease ATP23 n=1 Tax=Anaeramoeba ignava TaxID=1746090 RepID=A0A9Q0L808_ANAIG|nr:inner membrane protease [Anaeramoeba ignava]
MFSFFFGQEEINDKLSVKKCEEQVEKCVIHNKWIQKAIQFLTECSNKIEDISSESKKIINCKFCEPSLFPHSRAYYRIDEKKIYLCANRLSINDVFVVLKHELTHFIDDKLGFDFLVPEIVACSEIRAAKNAECEHAIFKKKCTKKFAYDSIKFKYPNQSHEIIERIFDKCYNSKIFLKDNISFLSSFGFNNFK